MLTDSIDLIRKVGTNYTQNVPRNSLRAIKTQYKVANIEGINFDIFQTDPTSGQFQFREEQDISEKSLPSLLDNDRIIPNKKN